MGPSAASYAALSPAAPEGVGAHRVLVPEGANFLGMPIHPLTMADTVDLIVRAMRERRALLHVALNVAKLVNLRRNDDLRGDVMSADLVGIDGMGILMGARMLGIRVPERVAGVDLMERVLATCAEQGGRPYFLGARPDVLERAMAELRRRHPSLEIAGYRDGYFRPEQEEAVLADIKVARPDCLFVGMPTPKKERFMAAHRAQIDVPFVMGVGGGIDILAGHTRRAPPLWQRSGLEWLYRIVQEPRRMWRRYLVTNTIYAGILCRACAARGFEAVLARTRA